MDMPIDVVGISEMQKCGLKYVIHSPGGPVPTQDVNDLVTTHMTFQIHFIIS
jgi:hypothetical protein